MSYFVPHPEIDPALGNRVFGTKRYELIPFMYLPGYIVRQPSGSVRNVRLLAKNYNLPVRQLAFDGARSAHASSHGAYDDDRFHA
jgi:hypothetical protein